MRDSEDPRRFSGYSSEAGGSCYRRRRKDGNTGRPKIFCFEILGVNGALQRDGIVQNAFDFERVHAEFDGLNDVGKAFYRPRLSKHSGQ